GYTVPSRQELESGGVRQEVEGKISVARSERLQERCILLGSGQQVGLNVAKIQGVGIELHSQESYVLVSVVSCDPHEPSALEQPVPGRKVAVRTGEQGKKNLLRVIIPRAEHLQPHPRRLPGLGVRRVGDVVDLDSVDPFDAPLTEAPGMGDED